MLQPRLIPALLLDRNLHLVKTSRFSDRHYLGDPLNAAYVFSHYAADELLVLDIDAFQYGRLIPLDFVEALGCFTRVPLAVGGGIRELHQIQDLLALGVERVILGGVLGETFSLLAQAADRFGTSTISVVINAHRAADGTTLGYFGRGGEGRATPLLELARACEVAGAGEVIIHDKEREGTRIGFDLNLYSTLNNALTIPLVALGGCGSVRHIQELLQNTPISGVAAGSLFAYAPGTREVLLNYPSPNSSIRSHLGMTRGLQ